MKIHKKISSQKKKQRVTTFINPILVKRAKVHGVLEGLSISGVVERALDAYAPKVKESRNHYFNLKLTNSPAINSFMVEMDSQRKRTAMKQTKLHGVSR